MYTAVIIEPRQHKALSFVIHNILENLPDEWCILVFHGNENKDFVEEILQMLYAFKHRILSPIQLDITNLTIYQYNKMLVNSNFYKCIPTEIFLIFQTDTMILHQNRHLINDFLKYDYVGAPWRNGCVGNGGFSLRRKSKMIEICEKVPHFNYYFNEDVYFSLQKLIKIYKPNWRKAMIFSVETIFYESSFAIHSPWKHLNTHEMGVLRNKYPDIDILIELNK